MPEHGKLTFHQLCQAGFASRMSRTGETEDDIAAAMAAMYGTTLTGGDIRAMHVDGYSSHVIDMVAGTDGRCSLDLIAQALQMFISGPHASCPTCSCGITEAERRHIAAAYQRNTTEGRAALLAVRATQGQIQPRDCHECALAR